MTEYRRVSQRHDMRHWSPQTSASASASRRSRSQTSFPKAATETGSRQKQYRTGYKSTGVQVSAASCLEVSETGHRVLDAGRWTLDARLWTPRWQATFGAPDGACNLNLAENAQARGAERLTLRSSNLHHPSCKQTASDAILLLLLHLLVPFPLHRRQATFGTQR